MTGANPSGPRHSPTKEPKFCRCRVCREYFYADTIEAARVECLAHGVSEHPGWDHDTVCYCPD
jgi:hypothetical protein